MNLENISTVEVLAETLRLLLQRGWVEVTFLKKDNTPRVMLCTTDFNRIPLEYRPKEREHPKEEVKADNIIDDIHLVKKIPAFKVFESDIGWRSFNIERVTKVVLL